MPDNADDFADDFGIFVHGYGFVFGVFGREVNDSWFADEAFDGGVLLGNAGDNDIAVLGGILGADDDQIVVKNTGADHRVAFHA